MANGLALSSSALYLCPLLFALCSLPSALCPLLFALTSLLFARSLTVQRASLSMTIHLPRDFGIVITAVEPVCSTIAGTYVNGRRLPLQGRGWGFESLRAYQSNCPTNFSLSSTCASYSCL